MQKTKKLLVRFPDGTIIFHSTSESTYLAAIRRIIASVGGERLCSVGLEISHLPVFTRTPDDARFGKYMKYLVDGWYALCIGGTSNKYLQLCAISDKLNLGLKICIKNENPFTKDKLSREFVESECSQLDIGKPKTRKTTETLVATYGGRIYKFGYRDGKVQFSKLIQAIDAKRVLRLNLKSGKKDLLTTLRITESQYQCGALWLNVPGSTRDKRKILCTIKSLLHLNMTIEVMSPHEAKAKLLLNSILELPDIE